MTIRKTINHEWSYIINLKGGPLASQGTIQVSLNYPISRSRLLVDPTARPLLPASMVK